MRMAEAADHQNKAAKVVECLLEARPRIPKGYTGNAFWLRKGQFHPAPDGHEQWVVDNFPDAHLEHSGGDEEREAERYANYAVAEKAGFTRVTRIGDTVYLDTNSLDMSWRNLPRADRRAVEEYTFERNLSVVFDGVIVINKPRVDPES